MSGRSSKSRRAKARRYALELLLAAVMACAAVTVSLLIADAIIEPPRQSGPYWER